MASSTNVNHRVIAEEAGVCRATVSLALRDHASIPEETRRRIKAVAQRLGYRAHPVISTYMHYVSRKQALGRYHATLAMIADVPFAPFPVAAPQARLNVPQQFRQGIERRAAELGYRVETFVCGDQGLPAPRLLRVLRTRGIAGLIFAESPGLFEMNQALDWADFSAVTYGYGLKCHDLSRACSNHFVIVTRLLDILRDRGYRRIGFVSSHSADQKGFLLARSAFLGFQSESSPRSRVPLFGFDEWDAGAFGRWVRRHKPDVVVTHDGTRVAEALVALGIEVPGQVGVASYRHAPHESRISGFSQDYPEVGAAAVDLLVENIHRNERGPTVRPRLLLIEGSWHEGQTL